MKNLYITVLSLLTLLVSCKSEPKNNIKLTNTIFNNDSIQKTIQTDVKIGLPIGFNKLIEYNFPKSWKNLESIDDNNPEFRIDKISKKGYDSISYFIESYYDKLYNSLKIDKKRKLNIIPSINKLIDNDKKAYFKIDSAYYSATVLKNNNYILEIYKDGDKYNNLRGYENSAVVNYITLVCFDLNKKIKDYKTIYYYDHALYAYDNTFFYIDKNLNIILKDFDVDETETRFLGIRKYRINDEGIFQEISHNINITGEENNESKKDGFSKINKKYQGNFSASIKTEATTTGMASLTYNFSISDSIAVLEEISYHEPVICNGNYKTKEKNNVLELYYADKNKNCETNGSNFTIKNGGNKYYIKGLGGEGTINEWIILNKK